MKQVKRSAGILAYHLDNGVFKVLLVHPGGPFFKNKDAGVWSVPKGEYADGEDPLTVALREFTEETGNQITSTHFIPLQPVRLKSGKTITAWGVEAYFDQCFISSDDFEMEWPPHSGKLLRFPETDQAAWFTLEEATVKLNPAQVPLAAELAQRVTSSNF